VSYLYKCLLFLFLLPVLSCNNELRVVPIPENVLPPDSMVSVLRDLHLMESGINGHFFQSNNISSDRSVLREIVFEKHKIESDRFLKSLEFYSANPEHFDAVYEQIIIELSKLQNLD
jgi:hypothetical protein